MTNRANLQVVVIGRNEGENLDRCLRSMLPYADTIVYVDSGSTDDSLEIARNAGVRVVELDTTVPFTAGRARNAGFYAIRDDGIESEFTMFVDGDCETVAGWISTGLDFLKSHAGVALVCGRRRERFPDASVFNTLCDIEWNTPDGEALECGGDFIIRTQAFNSVEGFDASIIAGEEPELCCRIRQSGWKIWRIDSDMTLHDANISRFSQWWKRNVRGGHALAEWVEKCPKETEQGWTRSLISVVFWAFLLPVGILLAALSNPWWCLLLIIYPLQVLRLNWKMSNSSDKVWYYPTFLMIGKFAEFQGIVKFLLGKFLRRQARIIEYR